MAGVLHRYVRIISKTWSLVACFVSCYVMITALPPNFRRHTAICVAVRRLLYLAITVTDDEPATFLELVVHVGAHSHCLDNFVLTGYCSDLAL